AMRMARWNYPCRTLPLGAQPFKPGCLFIRCRLPISVMARLRDLIPAVRSVGPIRFGMNVWREVGADNLFALAAALAYAWLFAIFPFLIFLLTLTAYV